MDTPTLRQLDIFAQMIASGSVAECARDLAMRPSEIERQIDALETRLGHQLFDRQGGMVTLTEAGRKTVEAMQLLAETPPEQWDDTHAVEEIIFPPLEVDPTAARKPIKEATALPSTAPGETITIAAHPSIFSHFQDALTAFEQTNSDIAITLDFDTHTAERAIRQLAAGRADIAYFYALGAPDGWPTRYAWSEQLSLYIGSDHPLASQDVILQSDLRDIAPVMLLPGNSLRPLIDAAMAGAEIDVTLPALETDNLFDIVTLVRQGSGYFAAFGSMARDFARMNGIRRLPLGFPLPAIEVRQAVRSGVPDDSVTATLSEYLFR
ncbi:MAG: LysR family transcriptional regulator [Sphingobium sp.]